MRPLKKKEKAKRRLSARAFQLWLHRVDSRCLLIVIAGTIALIAMTCAASAPKRYSLTVGSIATQTITANKDVVDEITTEQRREAAAAAVEPTYQYVPGASEEVLSTLDGVFSELRKVQQYGMTLRSGGETQAEIRQRSFSDEEIAYARSLVTIVPLTDYQLATLMRTETETFEEMVMSVTTAVSTMLNTTVREGQVNETIETILQIVGYKVETSLFQNILPTVLRTCVQPNMVIEQESTEIARQEARAAVDPVIYQQGQNIVREGEKVNRNQYEMLLSLGLLENNQVDFYMYIGSSLMIAVSVYLLMLMLRPLTPSVFHDMRRISVVMVVLILCMGINIAMIKLLDVYIMPVAACAILLTGLLGVDIALAGAFVFTALVSCLTMGSASLTTEMVHLLLMTLVSGGFSVFYLKHRPQRAHALLCGLYTGAINFILLMLISMMTTSSLLPAMENALWCLVGGLLSGVLAAALQPAIETVFNLATPSKLLELGNPNQPLLRRLMLEAPGTYHHSIVVANLSEAAAEKIGANPLLARTGAYFHDIGKLKRPMYFKENQMDVNPHDHTDPYVSAAIVTTHTRDGLVLAQKHRLPVEIQRIIVEHHGDTPVMFFYHKALQLNDGRKVDIADFRYDGTRPQTKESAIVMLADTIEAAVRSMPSPTPQAIEKFIEKLVKGKLEDGQLSNSPLTLRDIDAICEAFANVLSGVFHERIEYPDVAVPKRDAVSSAPTAADAEKAEQKTETQPNKPDEPAEQTEVGTDINTVDNAEAPESSDESSSDDIQPAHQENEAVSATSEDEREEQA